MQPPTTPRQALEAICERHALPLAEALDFLPLAERALAAPLTRRQRLWWTIERGVARRATQRKNSLQAPATQPDSADACPEKGSNEPAPSADRDVLLRVASLLHRWSLG